MGIAVIEATEDALTDAIGDLFMLGQLMSITRRDIDGWYEVRIEVASFPDGEHAGTVEHSVVFGDGTFQRLIELKPVT